jgi:hypothetical protein
MDEEQGNVIDGTARARHWGRLREKPSQEPDAGEFRSDAPKSLASSLLVPADMLDAGALVPPPVELASHPDETNAEPVMAEGGSTAALGLTVGAQRQNLFLSPDAAVVDEPRQRPKHRSGEMLRVVCGEVARVREVFRVPAPPTVTLPRPRWVAIALALVGVVAVGAELAAQSPTTSPAITRASGGTAAIPELDQLKEALLTSVTRALAATEAARPRAVRARPTRRPRGHTQVRANTAVATVRSTSISSSYTPTSGASAGSGGATSSTSGSGSGTATPSTSAANPASTSGGSTSAFGSSGALGPGSSPNG